METKTTRYFCAQCQEPARIVNGQVVRTCEHTDASIVASASATTHGSGAMQQKAHVQ